MNGLVDIIIADITAGQRNRCFAEIGPRKQNPLYGMYTHMYTHTLHTHTHTHTLHTHIYIHTTHMYTHTTHTCTHTCTHTSVVLVN